MAQKNDDRLILTEKLKIKLCEALDPNDALAIDVFYHSHCWRDHVDQVLRKRNIDESTESGHKGSLEK